MNNTTPKLTDQPIQQSKRWQGIGFLLHGLHYVVAADSVTEIIPHPKTTALPGASNWIKGIANVNGRLVAIISLGGFISGIDDSSPDNRVLVIPNHELAIGLVVDEVTGIKQFSADKYARQTPLSVPPNMQPFTQGAYDSQHIVFSVERFLGSEQFLTADAGF